MAPKKHPVTSIPDKKDLTFDDVLLEAYCPDPNLPCLPTIDTNAQPLTDLKQIQLPEGTLFRGLKVESMWTYRRDGLGWSQTFFKVDATTYRATMHKNHLPTDCSEESMLSISYIRHSSGDGSWLWDDRAWPTPTGRAPAA
jgi:hypothetical protein